MTEIPIGYCPDVKVGWQDLGLSQDHFTEVMASRNGAEQRNGAFATPGYRRWVAKSQSLDRFPRATLKNFLNARRGKLDAFNFFAPTPDHVSLYSVGSLTAQTQAILPFADSSIYDIRVANVSQSWTIYKLKPRTNTYAAPFFDGAASYIDCGPSSTLRFAGDVTLSAWIFALPTGAERVIAANFQLSGAASCGVSLRLASSGVLTFYTGWNAGLSSGSSTSTVPNAVATHVAAVKSGSNVTFYINGVQKETVGGFTNQAASTLNFRIGADNAGSLWFRGLIEDARLYNAALSPSQVMALYLDGGLYPVPNSNLVGQWPLVEGTGTTTADVSGKGNTGTITAGTWTGGEDLIVFPSAQTGALLVTLYGRERVICRSDLDSLGVHFRPNGGDVLGSFDLAVKEVY